MIGEHRVMQGTYKGIFLQIATVICSCLMFCLVACAVQPVYGVSPASIANSNKLTVSLPKMHPKELAVKTPSGDWIYVVDLPMHYSFFPDFANNTSFTFPEDLLQGVQYVDGKPVMTKVFTQAGQYEFYFADNLETEPENTFYLSYTVKYQP